jgi:FR47-like protein
LPAGLTFRPITMDQFDEINTLFPRKKSAYGYLFLKQAIEEKINLGIYDEKTNDLVGFCFEMDTRTLGMIMTKPEYQRSSLAMILYIRAAKIVVNERDLDLNWLVQHGNTKMIRGSAKYQLNNFDTVTSYHFSRNFNSISDQSTFQMYF